MIFTQSSTDGTSNIYDMYVLRGKIQADAESGATSLFLTPNITSIYEYNLNVECREPITYHNYIAGAIQIRIGDESRIIMGYYPATGEIVLDSAFSTAITKDTVYKLYSNYLVTPYYYFKVNTLPEITVSAQTIRDGIQCTAQYTQAENVLVKYYKFYLYKRPSQYGAFELISESDKIYSLNMNYTFVDHYGDGLEYKIVCEAVSQGGIVVSGETTLTPSEATVGVINDYNIKLVSSYQQAVVSSPNNVNYVYISIPNTASNVSGYSYQIYRKDLHSGEEILVSATLQETINIDFTASNNGKYQYLLTPVSNMSNVEQGITVTTDVITTAFSGWTITDVHDTGKTYRGKPYFTVGETWIFEGNIDKTSITQNTDKMLHVGYGKYPTLSETKTNYMSGSLSAMLGYISCPDSEYIDDIELVKKWRKFITQHCKFILKSQKGDVWLVVITESPITEYEEDSPLIPTHFTFSWAECGNISDYLFGRRDTNLIIEA